MTDPAELTLAERVRAVYQEVWHEFFDWEREYCLQVLASLASNAEAKPFPAATPPESEPNDEMAVEEDLSTDETDLSSHEATIIDQDCVQATYYDEDGEIYSQDFFCPTYVCETIVQPAQPYEACTYSHKNLYIADDQCEKLSFIPFADDPRFPASELIECYDSFAWEEVPSKKDPDYHLIAAEAARRLHFCFGIPFADIDGTGILPMVITGKKGLLRILNQRDTLPWTGSVISNLPPLPQADSPLPTALRKRVNGLRYLVCANLNCVEPYCPTHLNLDVPIRKSVNPRVDGDDKAGETPPCGYDCYKYDSYRLEGLTAWDEATMDDFQFILEGAADLSSCDLAVLCDKPCREVYANRRRYTANNPVDAEPFVSVNDSDSDTSSSGLIFDDIVRGSKMSDSLPPSEICQHPGRCDARADCRCYRKNLHCHRSCQCDALCRRRPKGCWCGILKSYKICGTNKCSCYRAGRECDPELCLKCGVKSDVLYYCVLVSVIFNLRYDKDVKRNGGCRNNGLQHGLSKALAVKEGSYGLGLFLLETAREGDLIGEYVGELISSRMADARGVLTRHLGRNYLFGLNKLWTLDAATTGNELRFINHASGKLANCRAEVREVNGDHRIGIYAVWKTIERGEELFMDYGAEYFTTR